MTQHCEAWRDRLSEYIDEDLSPAERASIESHLAGCVDCSSEVAGLRRVIAHAQALPKTSEPARDLWPEISRHLGQPSRGIVRQFPARARAVRWAWLAVPVAAMLALAVAAVVGWMTQRHTVSAPATARNVTATAIEAPREYEDSVFTLRQAVQTKLTRDPQVLEVIETNLATIDLAIAQYRDALSQEPQDEDVSARLAAARQRKIALLQQAVSLADVGTAGTD